ncbi:MAG TPA: hypothetical protein VEA37_10050 [Flavobacterium sp.]|nr:hypothetical protein [Flavobacterium sp.]
MSTIHGREVSFSDDTHEAKEFLKHPEHRRVAEIYFDLAEKRGKSYFYAGDGDRYEIEYTKGNEGENDSFRVRRKRD